MSRVFAFNSTLSSVEVAISRIFLCMRTIINHILNMIITSIIIILLFNHHIALGAKAFDSGNSVVRAFVLIVIPYCYDIFDDNEKSILCFLRHISSRLFTSAKTHFYL